MTIAVPLSTSGRWIVDSNGNRVKLAGVNWAGAHEDLMVSGGLAFLPLDTIAAQVQAWGFNSVRLTFAANTVLSAAPVNPAAVAANPELAGLTPWEVYQAVVAALTAEGLMVIPNEQLMYQGWCCSAEDTNGLWWNANWTYATFLSVWETVASAFAGVPGVVGYDIKNEPRPATIGGATYTPTWGTGATGAKGTDLRWLYEQVGNAIQAVDPGALIICEGSSVTSLEAVARYPVVLNVPDKVVYSLHDYPQAYAAGQTAAEYAAQWQAQAGFLLTEGIAPFWIGEFGLANDSMAALGGGNPMSFGDGLGAGPLSQGYGNWWDNFTSYWCGTLDADWCAWHLSGTHVQGTEPSTNQLQYADGDRCWDGVYATDWAGPASPAALAALQAVMAPALGPGVRHGLAGC
jgi:endoglucanase